jgi:hypothetical protein
VPEVAGTRRIEAVERPHELNDVDVGIVRPAFAVAETGSLYLSEREYRVNALGYLSQHLVALLDPAQIVGNLHHAYHRPEFFAARYACLMKRAVRDGRHRRRADPRCAGHPVADRDSGPARRRRTLSAQDRRWV